MMSRWNIAPSDEKAAQMRDQPVHRKKAYGLDCVNGMRWSGFGHRLLMQEFMFAVWWGKCPAGSGRRLNA